jgi:hypothetical protein
MRIFSRIFWLYQKPKELKEYVCTFLAQTYIQFPPIPMRQWIRSAIAWTFGDICLPFAWKTDQ